MLKEGGRDDVTKKGLVHYGIPLLCTLLCVAASLADLWAFRVNDWDFSYFSVLPWNLGNGQGWHVPFHELGAGFPFYAHHWQPFVLALVPFLTWFDSPYTLSVLHALAMGAWFFLLPLFVRQVYREAGREDYLGAALFWQLVLFVYTPFWGPWRYQTHITTLVSPALFLAVLCLHRRRAVWACFWCLLVAFGQERSSVAVFSVGMYAILILRQYRLGGGLCLASGLYFLGIVKVLFPFLRGGDAYAFSTSISPFHHFSKKCLFLLKYLAYTFFLPLAGKRAFLTAACSLPVLGIGLVSSRESMYAFGHHYQDVSAPFLLMAGVYGLLWLQEQRLGHRLFSSRKLLAAGCAVLLIVSFAQCRFLHPLVHLGFIATDPRRADYARLHEELEHLLRISEGKPLFVQSGIGPLVSLRTERYSLVGEADLRREFAAEEHVAISPLCGTYALPDYAPLQKGLDGNGTLELVQDSGRLRIYRGRTDGVPTPAH